MSDTVTEIPANEAWARLGADSAAVLIDVRTKPEWSLIGVADLSPIGRQPLLVSWQSFPDMAVNEDFVRTVRTSGVADDTAVYVMCRSGARSRAAAQALADAGFSRCFNISDGFEGDPDERHHRGTIGGWKAAGLPWIQQ